MSESGLPGTETAAPVPAGTPTPGVARSAGLVGIATMASRVLGLLRDWVFLTTFGAGHVMDAYNVAFRLPNLVRDLFAEGAMSAAFIPTFTRRLQGDGKESAWRLANTVITTLVLITGIVVLIAIIFATPLVTAFAGSYAEVPGK